MLPCGELITITESIQRKKKTLLYFPECISHIEKTIYYIANIGLVNLYFKNNNYYIIIKKKRV